MANTAQTALCLQVIACLLVLCNAIPAAPDRESSSFHWLYEGMADIEASVERFKNAKTRKAKNVILFVGDGMGLTTVTAGRIFKGQKDSTATGEEYQTDIDRMPHTGLLKTYGVDRQTVSRPAAATALLCGFKTTSGMTGVASGEANNCTALPGLEVKCALEHAKDFGKATGIVTTASVQTSTTAAAFAKTVKSRWYSDIYMSNASKQAGCKDVADQLIAKAKTLNVVLGGGRSHMKPYGSIDREYPHHIYRGLREDGRNLIEEWMTAMEDEDAQYVWNKDQFDDIDPDKIDYLMGLFEPYRMRYSSYRDQDGAGEPSLAEMTEKAIQILQKDRDGYFLLVEAAQIGRAHHYNYAHLAMEEFVDFERAVGVAKNMTSTDDTLIIVTANNGHVFTIGSGYPVRGNPILGLSPNNDAPKRALDGRYFTSAGYADGRGASSPRPRPPVFPTVKDFVLYNFQATVPFRYSSHSSEDVPVFASGPWSHLVTGVHEQNYIAHVMYYSACIGPHAYYEHCLGPSPNDRTGASDGKWINSGKRSKSRR